MFPELVKTVINLSRAYFRWSKKNKRFFFCMTTIISFILFFLQVITGAFVRERKRNKKIKEPEAQLFFAFGIYKSSFFFFR